MEGPLNESFAPALSAVIAATRIVLVKAMPALTVRVVAVALPRRGVAAGDAADDGEE
jgi:hypothetical protein